MTRNEAGSQTLLLALNPTEGTVRFPIPRSAGGAPWNLVLDTHGERSDGIAPPSERPQFAREASELDVKPRSIRILLS